MADIHHPARYASPYMLYGALGALAFIALTPSVSFIPLSFLIASMIGVMIHLRSSSSQGPAAVGTIVLLALGETLARLGPGLSALSTPLLSFFMLFITSTLSVSLNLIPVYLWVLVASRPSSSIAPITKLLLFPALWTSTQLLQSISSPMGRLSIWTPSYGIDHLRWLLPIFGPSIIDWTVALTALLLVFTAEAAGAIPPISDLPARHVATEPDLLDINWEEYRDSPPPSQRSLISPESLDAAPKPTSSPEELHATTAPPRLEVTLALVFLAAITLPPLLFPLHFDLLPRPTQGHGISEISLACILPNLTPSKKNPSSLFEAYLQETTTLGNTARIHVWPEGAVRFSNALERDVMLERLKGVTGKYKVWVGVGFDDFVPHDPDEGREGKRQREGMRRNGIVLVGPEGVEFEYYKQHLVPITESFGMIPGTQPPPLHTIKDFPYGPKLNSRGRRATRPLVVTPAICLDFAHPSTLLYAESDTDKSPSHIRPDIVLAPGATWDALIGDTMRAQTSQRIDEIGAYAGIWCDRSGVSGLVGRGQNGVQRGGGSFVRTVGIPLPPRDEHGVFLRKGEAPTMYARWGDWGALGVMWGLVLVLGFGLGGALEGVVSDPGSIVGGTKRAVAHGVDATRARVGGPISYVMSGFGRARGAIVGAMRSIRGRVGRSSREGADGQSQTGNLIDV